MRLTGWPKHNLPFPPVRGCQGFTLAEMSVAVGVFAIVVLAFVYVNLFCFRQNELVESKLGASMQSRYAFDQLASDIRSSKIWQIGNGSAASFTAIPSGTTQLGNALQLNLSINTNTYVRYYFDTNNYLLCRIHSGDASATTIAQYLTNSLYFVAEDYQGNVKSDLSYKYLIHVKLQFCQYQYPLTIVGPGYFYDYYKLEFRVTPHCPDGT